MRNYARKNKDKIAVYRNEYRHKYQLPQKIQPNNKIKELAPIGAILKDRCKSMEPLPPITHHTMQNMPVDKLLQTIQHFTENRIEFVGGRK